MTDKPKLLSGGNPQIPLGYGDAPVQAWIAAASGWKSDAGTLLRMEQTGFRPEQKQAWGGANHGWRENLANLEQALGRLD